MTIFALTNRSLVRFSGGEAANFLNDLITTNTSTLPQNTARPGAVLTPQGRILFDFLISRDGNDLILEVDAPRRNDFIKKMMLYRLRRPIEIEADPRHAAACMGEAYIGLKGVLSDARFEHENIRVGRLYATDISAALPHEKAPHAKAPHEKAPPEKTTSQAWQALRYRYGIAEGAAELPPEKALPLEARLDLSHGIDFEKGCYIGQEVTARTRYRGLVKRSYLPLMLGARPKNKPPLDIVASGKNIGQLLGVAPNTYPEKNEKPFIGLASIRLEAIDENHPLTVWDIPATPLFPHRLMPLPSKKT